MDFIPGPIKREPSLKVRKLPRCRRQLLADFLREPTTVVNQTIVGLTFFSEVYQDPFGSKLWDIFWIRVQEVKNRQNTQKGPKT